MTKYSGPSDIYKELVEDADDNWLYGLVAFAVIEEQKVEWIKHHTVNTGHPPTAAEVQDWYEDLPAGALLRAKGTAEGALKTYSEEVVSQLDETVRQETIEGVIVGEIRQGRKFWPQLGLNIVGGMASSILFGALLFMIAFLVLNDRSPIEFGAKFNSGDGQEVKK